MKPFFCKKHGAVEPYVAPSRVVKRLGGQSFLNRTCRECKKVREQIRQQTPRSKEYFRNWHQKNRVRISAHGSDYRRMIRLAVVASFGGACECCGIRNDEFLTIDHVNGDGGKLRKTTQKGAKVYRDLYFERVSRDDYRLLCWNCNVSRSRRGYCPHEALLHLVEGA